MDICKCGSAALNDHPESGLCDKCYWRDQAKKLRARVEDWEDACRRVILMFTSKINEDEAVPTTAALLGFAVGIQCRIDRLGKDYSARVEELEGKCDGLAGRNKELAKMCQRLKEQIDRQKALLKTKPEAGLKAIADALSEPLDCGHPAE